MTQTAPVRRPFLMAIALAGFAAAATILGAGLFDLHGRRAAAPLVIAVDKADLEEALEAAPWVSSGIEEGDEGLAPIENPTVLWIVTAPHCKPCRAFERESLPHLLDAGVETRVILVAPRSLADTSREAREIAVLTKSRDWTALHLWLQENGDAAMTPLEPAETEGVLEWGRQSGERIEDVLKRNDVKLSAPALFWRNGPEWRAAVPAEPHVFKQIERELAPRS